MSKQNARKGLFWVIIGLVGGGVFVYYDNRDQPAPNASNAGVLSKIVFPDGRTFSERLQNLEGWMKLSKLLYDEKDWKFDRRLEKLADHRRDVLMEWQQYGSSYAEVNKDPATPVAMIDARHA